MGALAYRPDVDGLRALAIVLVVLYHAFPEAVPGGFVGVDVFFVISGYLITRLLLAGLAEGSFSFADFYARRARRILPALVLVLAAAGALGAVLLTREDLRQLGQHAMAGASFTSNLLLWHEAGYFDGAAETKPFLHLWSLAVEEQFYLGWPLLLWLAWRRRWSVAALAAGVGVISFLAGMHALVVDPEGAFYSPASRIWELMVGCVLAGAESGAPRARDSGPRGAAAAFLGLALIAASLALINRYSAFPGAWALLPTLGAALVIAAGPRAWPNARLLARAPMVQLGLMSYALYLWHWPPIAWLNLRYPEGAPLLYRVAAIVAAAALAWATYALLERPLRRMQPRALVPALAASLALVFAGGLVASRAALGPDGSLEAQLEQSRAWPAAYEHDAGCAARLRPPGGYCALADVRAAPTHALIGDSHANHFFPGLAEAVGAGGGNLVHLGGAGCAPLAGVENTHRLGCGALMDAALAFAAAEPSIGTVILAGNWHAYARGTRFSAHRNRHAAPLVLVASGGDAGSGNAALFEASLARTVGQLQQAGKRVVFLNQAPELETRFETCLQQLRGDGWDERTCAVARRKVEDYARGYTGLVAAALAGRDGVIVLDPLEVFCDRDLCRMVSDGELLYRDDVHLSTAGSRRAMRRLWASAAGRL